MGDGVSFGGSPASSLGCGLTRGQEDWKRSGEDLRICIVHALVVGLVEG
jgi:hypothetical protein